MCEASRDSKSKKDAAAGHSLISQESHKEKQTLYKFRGLAVLCSVMSGPSVSPLAIETNSLSTYYYVATSFSIAASALIIISYMTIDRVRKHPSKLMVWRSVYDLFFCVSVLISQILDEADSLKSDSDDDSPNAWCTVTSLAFQFTIFGSQAWYGVMALDLYKGLTNPLSEPKNSMTLYHFLVFSSSSLTVIILGSSHYYGVRAFMELCWIKYVDDVNIMTWAIFILPTIVIFIFSLTITVYAYFRLTTNKTFFVKERRQILHDGLRTTASFIVYWIFMLIIYIYTSTQSTAPQTSDTNFPLYAALAVGIGLRGFFDFPVWAFNHEFFNLLRERWMSLCTRRTPDSATVSIHQILSRPLTTSASSSHRSLAYHSPALSPSSPSSSSPSSSSSSSSSSTLSKTFRKDFISLSLSGMLKAFEKARSSSSTADFSSLVPSSLSVSASSRKKSLSNASASRAGSKDVFDERQLSGDDGELEHDDFDGVRVIQVRYGNERETVEFVDYAPKLFRRLRDAVFHVSDDYALSLACSPDLVDSMMSTFCDGGRSESFSFFTADRRYMVKTLTLSEAKLLLSILVEYAHHMQSSSSSLLCKITGFHRVSLDGYLVYMIVMKNCLSTHEKCDEKYDIKGSTVDRHALNPNKPGTTLKDNDFKIRLKLTEVERARFIGNITSDAKFLCSKKIMDYSLLLGIKFVRGVQPQNVDGHSQDGGVYAQYVEGPGKYYYGIIDILQEYNWSKKLEYFYKVFILCKSKGISCVNEQDYCKRFIEAIETKILNDEQPPVFFVPSSLSSSYASSASSSSCDFALSDKLDGFS